MRTRTSYGLLVAAQLALAGCADGQAHAEGDPHGAAAAAPATASAPPVVVEPREKLLPMFPCSSCHQTLTPNPTPRKLEKFHTLRNTELRHGITGRWCYQCHSAKNIDRLVIVSGEQVSFDEAYLMCGSCHGDKLRDWRLAIHGKTMGHWRGDKLRRSCTGCHNPHDPKFAAIEPESPPTPPQEIHPR